MEDVEKTFESVDQKFLIDVLETFGFEKDLMRWINIYLKNQDFCLTNTRTITRCSKLE